MTIDWFVKYTTHVANNIRNKEGNVRFTYNELHAALKALEAGNEVRVPKPVLELFANIVGIMPPEELSDNQQRVLLLTLLNMHMAYSLVSGHLLNRDTSIDKVE